jgi:hypothetical protein
VLLDAAAGWLSMVAGQAQRHGDQLLTEVGVGPLGPRLGRRVAIRLGQPVRFASMALLRCPDPGRAEAVAFSGNQITKATVAQPGGVGSACLGIR